jgi:DNA polymerase-3 subunit epsilon
MMCAFDTETTGTSAETDRLVTACVSWVDGSGKAKPVTRTWLADPGVDIPPRAAEIHGITTEYAREHGASPDWVLGEIASELLRATRDGVPVVAFNAPFDLTLMDRETRRHELEPFGPHFEAVNGLVVDPLVIDKAVSYRTGKRPLGLVAEHYGVKAGKAHDAAGDAITAARVAWAIAAKHPRIAGMTLADLHAYQIEKKREQAKSLAEYFAKIGKNEPVDGSWPLRAWTGEVAA